MRRSGRRRYRWVALRICIYYAVVAIVLVGCADRLVLYPSREPVTVAGTHRVEIAGPVGPLEIWTMRSAAMRATSQSAHSAPAAYVLAFIGNAARAEYAAEDVASEWQQHRIEVWAVNYPGYGGSAGSARMKSIAPAALAAYDAMKKAAGDRPTFISGESLGTTAALYVAAHRPVSGLVLKNPPPLRNLILGEHGWWNLWLGAVPVALSVPSDLDSLANGRRATAPAVFILGEADEVVPPKYHMMVVDAYAGPKQVIHIPGAHHNDPTDSVTWPKVQQALDWLIKSSAEK